MHVGLQIFNDFLSLFKMYSNNLISQGLYQRFISKPETIGHFLSLHFILRLLRGWVLKEIAIGA